MAFIVSLIQQAIIDDLDYVFTTDTNINAGVVRLGPLQEDPTKLQTSVLIYENDPSDIDGWMHTQSKSPMNEPMYGNILPGYFEIGGSELYERKFTVSMKVYLTKGVRRTRQEAKEIFDEIHGTAIHALRNSERLPGIRDDFGESVVDWRHCVRKSRMLLRGGPPSSWIGEGKIWVAVVTSLP